ncbi:MAG: hypothetical protein H0V80_06615 [Acidobacteria bacterium]|nr:hypothetical protein [Acidobacteriota bacterium]
MRTGARVSVMAMAGVVALVVGVGGARAQGAVDPYVGTWKMNLAKSTSSAPLPKSRTVTITSAGANAIKVVVDEVGADGAAANWSFTTAKDGKDTAVTGSPMADTAAMTMHGPRSGVTVYKKAGKAVREVTTDVSADGKTFTTTSKGTDAQGKPVTATAIYERS